MSVEKRHKVGILYVTPVSLIGGAENSLSMLVRKLDKGAFDPRVVLPADGPLTERFKSWGIETVVFPLQKINIKNPVPYLRTVARLTKLMKEEQIELVHCNMDICNQYALPAARLNGIPIICHTRNLLFSRRAFRRMFLAYADVLIANTHAIARSYSVHTRSSQRMVVINNGVNIETFSPPSVSRRHRVRREFGIPDDAYVVGMVGRINPEKGQDIMIKALAQIVLRYPNTYLLIAGDAQIGDFKRFLKEIEDLVVELGLTEQVLFTGFIEDVRPIYECLDLVVIPSRFNSCGRTAMEAMAMKKPVVASWVGDAPEVVEDGSTALLVLPADSSALADAICRLIEEPALARELGENGRKRAERHFSIERHTREIEHVYQEIMMAKGKR